MLLWACIPCKKFTVNQQNNPSSDPSNNEMLFSAILKLYDWNKCVTCTANVLTLYSNLNSPINVKKITAVYTIQMKK